MPLHASLAALMAKPIAHRGLHDRKAGVIENSHEAFSLAAASGFGIECDVQITRDGEAVVFHDFDLDRLTGDSGRVDARSAADLLNLRLTGSEAGNCIHSLSEMMDLVGGRVPVVVEIKSRFDGDLRLTRRVVETLQGCSHPVCIESFDPRIMAALRMMAPDIPRGIVAMSDYEYSDYKAVPADEKRAMANLLHFHEVMPDFLSWNIKDLPHCGPFLCRTELGVPVSTWTVRTKEDVAHASAHADQIVFEGFMPE